MARRDLIAIAERNIRRAIEREIIPKVVDKIRRACERELPQVISAGFENDPTINSLKFGLLRGEFGLIAPGGKVKRIISALSKNIEVTTRYFKGAARISISVYKPDSLAHITSLPQAYQRVMRGEGGRIPWLNWLLFAGNRTVVPTHWLLTTQPRHHLRIKRFRGPNFVGRSGLPFLMKPMSENTSGFEAYRVNPSHQGTRDDNFVTRRFSKLEPAIIRTIRKIRDQVIAENNPVRR